MREQETHLTEQCAGADPEPAAEQTPQPAAGGPEKQVPVGEAIRYRKRAQAAEKELAELKTRHETQGRELAQLKDTVETLEAGAAAAVPDGAAPRRAATPDRTQGVKESRTGGARTRLQTAARQAAVSGSRADVQAYLRIRRHYV